MKFQLFTSINMASGNSGKWYTPFNKRGPCKKCGRNMVVAQWGRPWKKTTNYTCDR